MVKQRNANRLLLFIGFVVFFIPGSYAIPSQAYTLWQLSIIVVTAVAIIAYIACGAVTVRWLVFCLAFLTYYCLSTLVNSSDGSFNIAILNCAKAIGLITLFSYGFKRSKTRTLEAFLAASITMCAFDYVAFIQYQDMPGGMKADVILSEGSSLRNYVHYFLFTHDNGTVFYYLPTLAVLWFYALSSRKYLMPLAVVFAAAVLYMYCRLYTVTAICATALFLVVAIVAINAKAATRLSKILDYRMACIIGLAFCSITVLLMTSGWLDPLTMALGKFHARDYIWHNTIAYIFQNPLMGMGTELGITTTLRIGINHCHNILLQILYTGGFVSLVLFLYTLFLCRPSGKVKVASVVLNAYIVSYFVASTFDWYPDMTIALAPFVVLYYCSAAEPLVDCGTLSTSIIINNNIAVSVQRFSSNRRDRSHSIEDYPTITGERPRS